MEFFEMIASFFPVLMIIIFIIAFIRKSAKDRKPSEANPSAPPKPSVPYLPVSVKKKIKPWLDRFPVMAENPPAEPQPQTETVAEAMPQNSEGLHILKDSSTTSEENKKAEEASSSDYYSRQTEKTDAPGLSITSYEKINKLPELKKAVIWSEIIGKPKSLE